MTNHDHITFTLSTAKARSMACRILGDRDVRSRKLTGARFIQGRPIIDRNVDATARRGGRSVLAVAAGRCGGRNFPPALLFGGLGLFIEGLKWLLIIALVMLLVGAITGSRLGRSRY